MRRLVSTYSQHTNKMTVTILVMRMLMIMMPVMVMIKMMMKMMTKAAMIMKPTTFCSVPVKGSLLLESRLDLLFDNLCWIKWD